MQTCQSRVGLCTVGEGIIAVAEIGEGLREL